MNQQQPKHTNSLINETSPYLLQHAHNPVNWYAWNEETLDKAKREDKLILVSIGYSACHWCHVMEHESFEDETGVSTFEWTKKVSPDVLTLQDGKSKKALQFRI